MIISKVDVIDRMKIQKKLKMSQKVACHISRPPRGKSFVYVIQEAEAKCVGHPCAQHVNTPSEMLL